MDSITLLLVVVCVILQAEIIFRKKFVEFFTRIGLFGTPKKRSRR